MENELNAAKAVNKEILQKSKESIRNKQIAIVGDSEETLIRIDQSFEKIKIEHFFVKEQWDLFEFRSKFFHEHFPEGSFVSEDSDYFNVIFYQICTNFDEVVTLASRDNIDRKVYFEANGNFAEVAADRFSYSRLKVDLAGYEKPADEYHHIHAPFEEVSEYPVSFCQLAHIVAELFPGPESLEEIAMKVVLKQDGTNSDKMNVYVKEKSEHGMFSLSDFEEDTKHTVHMSKDGQEVMRKLKQFYM